MTVQSTGFSRLRKCVPYFVLCSMYLLCCSQSSGMTGLNFMIGYPAVQLLIFSLERGFVSCQIHQLRNWRGEKTQICPLRIEHRACQKISAGTMIGVHDPKTQEPTSPPGGCQPRCVFPRLGKIQPGK